MADDLASLLGTPELGQPAPMPAPIQAPPAAPAAGHVQRNNPLNLRPLPAGSWPGQSGIDGGFASFDTPESGWSAADQNLLAQINRHGARSIGDVVGRWAPASDHNDPNAYAARVAGELGIGPADDVSQRILTDADFRHRVLSSMAGVETGKPQAYGGAGAPDLGQMLGVSPEAPAPAPAPDPNGPLPGTYKGGEGMTGPQQAASQTIQMRPGFNPQAIAGTPENPYFLKPGYPIPTGPTVHWVDLDGHEHINPGGLAEQAGSALQGFGQGVGMDTVASASRLTGGGMAVGDPMAAALSQSQGGPSAFDIANAAQQGVGQQQQQYAAQHVGDPYAQGGRFLGQAVPATVAAAAVPEAIPLDALGNPVVRAGAGMINNALRGTAAAAANVGANPDVPVAQQLAVGAVGGAAVPAVFSGAAKVGEAVTGLGRSVAPEMASLADVAQTKYKIPVASGQIASPDDKVAFSQMLKSDPKAQALVRQQRQQWMKGVTSTYGDASGDISPPTLRTNQERIGGNINAVADRVGAIDATETPHRLSGILSNASQDPGFDGTKNLGNLIKTLSKAIGPDGTMSGAAYKQATDYNSPLMIAVRAGKSPYPAQIKNALDDALEASAAPEDVAALRNARWQYKNLMTVAKAAENQNNIGADGVFTPSALNTATTSNFKARAFQGAGDLDELNAIRRHIMNEPPDSGTPARIKDMLKNVIPGVEAAGLTGAASTLLHRPEAVPATLAMGLVGTGGKILSDALKRNRTLGSASGIIERSLPGTPRPVRSALDGILNTTRPLQVPLSALSGVRALNTFEPATANAAP